MKYFITGATGFIGAHLVKSLIESGHEVHALCRSEAKARLLHSEARIFIGDILDKDILIKGMATCDYVFHLAAYASVWAKDSGHFYKVNVTGTNLVLDAAKISGIKRTIVVSTAGIYGASFDSIVNEDFVRRKDFFNEYEGSKALSESHVKDYVIGGLDVILVCPTRVYGPYLFGEPESVTMMIRRYVKGRWRLLPGPPDRIGNYVYVGDVVKGMISALNNGQKGRTYILGGENHSYREFFDVLGKVSGMKRKMIQFPIWISFVFAWVQLLLARAFGISPLITPKWVPKAKYHWAVSSERAVKELGYEITSLKDGLSQTLIHLNK